MNRTQKNICIIAGEASGDMHGAELIQEMRTRQPELIFWGIGGERMIKTGLEAIHHANEMAFLGFFEVVRHYPFIRRVFYDLLNQLKIRKPALVVLVDYPGFNLRFAKQANKQGFKTCYYISPQVWAWGHGRVKKMASFINRMLVILPFEKPFYDKYNMDVHFVGHPLMDHIQPGLDRESFFENQGLEKGKTTIGLLPGSRKQEIGALFPEMVKASRMLNKKRNDVQYILGMAPGTEPAAYNEYVTDSDSIRFVKNDAYNVMAHSDLVLVASGTATLETALFGTPMIVVYKVAALTYWLGKLLIKVPYIGLVNIVAGKQIMPELIQRRANAVIMFQEISKILESKNTLDSMHQSLENIAVQLGQKGVSARAADLILEMI